MIRRSKKTTDTMLANVNRWFAAEWKRIRDARMIEARIVKDTLGRRAMVRSARFANHEFIRYMRGVA